MSHLFCVLCQMFCFCLTVVLTDVLLADVAATYQMIINQHAQMIYYHQKIGCVNYQFL